MSIKCSERVWKESQHKGGERLVLLAIARYARDDGSGAWPSIATLVADTKLSDRSVQYALRNLEKSGELLIEQSAGPKGCNAYTILIGRGCNNFTPAIIAPVQSTTEGGAIYDIKGVKPIAPESLIESVKEPLVKRGTTKKKKRPLPPDFEVTDEMYNKAHRKYPDLDIDAATEQWRDAMLAKGFEYLDWDAGWRTGMAMANKWAIEREGQKDESTKFGRAVVRAGREIAQLYMEPLHSGTNGRTPADNQGTDIFRLPEPKTPTGSG